MKLPQDSKHMLPFHIRPPLRLRIGLAIEVRLAFQIEFQLLPLSLVTQMSLFEIPTSLNSLSKTYSTLVHIKTNNTLIWKKKASTKCSSLLKSHQLSQRNHLQTNPRVGCQPRLKPMFSREDFQGHSALHLAALYGHLDVVKAMLAKRMENEGGGGVRFGVMNQKSEKVHPGSLT